MANASFCAICGEMLAPDDYYVDGVLPPEHQHICPAAPPAPGGAITEGVTITLSRKHAEAASFATRYTASHLRRDPEYAEMMNAATSAIEAALAAAQAQPGGEASEE